MSKTYIKNGFHSLENLFLLIGMKDLFKNTFPLNRKVKLAVAVVSDNGRKKWLPLARKSAFTSRNKVVFHKWYFLVFTSRKKSLNKRILFQLNRKSVSTQGNGESVEEDVSARRKTASIDRNI